MRSKIFTHVVANIVLVVTVIIVASVSFVGAATNVFNNTDNSPIYRGNGVKQVSLMINVYWGTEYINSILEIFKKYDITTTFFVGGTWVEQYPEMLQKIVENGHEIGNHGYRHREQSKLSYNENKMEISACGKLALEYCGVNMTLFAPPAGDFSNETLSAASDLGYKTIMWSRDTIDWRDKDADTVYSRATKNTDSGELILMHPTKHTMEAMEKIVLTYLERGFEIVTVSKNIGEV